VASRVARRRLDDDRSTTADEMELEPFDHTAMDWTRGLQLGATVALGGAAALGAIQFADEYGFHANRADTACANGGGVFGDCGDAIPWPHAAVVGSASVLGVGALIASTQVDYDRAGREDSDWRIYEVTRWVGLAMFVVQGTLGFIAANAIGFGWADADRDFNTLQGLATAHLVLGVAYVGLETFNTILIF